MIGKIKREREKNYIKCVMHIVYMDFEMKRIKWNGIKKNHWNLECVKVFLCDLFYYALNCS